MRLGLAHHRIDHRHEALVRVVLQADHVELLGGRAALVGDGNGAGRQQALGLQLLAAQAHDHHLAAEVGVEADVAQGADRHDGIGRVDGHAAAVAVLERHHVVHMRVLRQQLGLDALHSELGHAGHALHGLRDREDVARAHRAVGIAVALEGVALERRQGRGLDRGDGQAVEFGCDRHAHHALVHPAAARQRLERVADHHVVAADGVAFGQVDERHLVALGHGVDQHQAVVEGRAGLQAAVVRDDGHVVGRVDADVQRRSGVRIGHREALSLFFTSPP